MPGGPIFNCYPGPFSNVRCNKANEMQLTAVSISGRKTHT